MDWVLVFTLCVFCSIASFFIYRPVYLKLKCSGVLEFDENGELNLRINKDMAGEKYIVIEQKIISHKKRPI